MYNPYSLINKTILITGASSGIGRTTAVECSKLGAKVIINGRNKERLNQTLDSLEGEGHISICGNLAENDTLQKIIDNIDILDGVVHCAGITKNIMYPFSKEEDFEEVMRINFFVPAKLSRLLIKKKKLAKNSSIVFISSVSGTYCTAPSGSIYSSSKGAVNGLVKGMAMDLAHKNIRVNAVCPGVVETNIFDAGTISQEQLEENKKRYPLKRFGQPQDIAWAVIYLLSDASSWITGSNLLIDGGLLLQ